MTIQSILKTYVGRDVSFQQLVGGGFRVSTRADVDKFNIWVVDA